MNKKEKNKRDDGVDPNAAQTSDAARQLADLNILLINAAAKNTDGTKLLQMFRTSIAPFSNLLQQQEEQLAELSQQAGTQRTDIPKLKKKERPARQQRR